MTRFRIAFACLLTALPGLAEPPSVTELEARLQTEPDNEVILYNLGMQFYLADEPLRAIAPWSRLTELSPHDWQTQTKLIQAYSACGKSHVEAREQALQTLYALREGGEVQDLNEAAYFIRDQFVVDESRVFAFEYFDLEADWHLGPLLWKFFVTVEEKQADHFVSVGSYDSTTELAVALGRIEAGERVYHLDQYSRDGKHQTYGFAYEKPDYDKTKAVVIQILEGTRDPISGFNPETQEITIEPTEEPAP